MNIPSPVVSVILPMYNAEKYVADSIQSVLNQTFKEWELLLVDDGSTDQTANIARSFVKDNRINYVYKTNGGQGNARNIGIRMAMGKYLAFIDADDLWDKNKLSSQLKVLQREDSSLVFSRLRCIDGDGTSLERNLGSGTGTYQGFTTLIRLVAGSIAIPNSSVMVEREKVNRVGNFNRIRTIEDYDLWFRLLVAGTKFYGMSEILGSYRKHEDQLTHEDSGQSLEMINYLNDLSKAYPGKQAFFKFLILQRLSAYYRQHSNKHEAKDECLHIFFSNALIGSHRFEKSLIDVVNFDNYMRFRKLLIRRFRKFETFLSLIND